MSERRLARRLFTGAVTAYGAGLIVWLSWPAFQETILGKIVAIPPFSLYLFEHLGVPGLTDRSRCDWMWCRPTPLGIAVAAVVWLIVAWGVSMGLARLIRSTRTASARS
jgi:hypothetical protein